MGVELISARRRKRHRVSRHAHGVARYVSTVIRGDGDIGGNGAVADGEIGTHHPGLGLELHERDGR